jgi:hypothetical protein
MTHEHIERQEEELPNDSAVDYRIIPLALADIYTIIDSLFGSARGGRGLALPHNHRHVLRLSSQ